MLIRYLLIALRSAIYDEGKFTTGFMAFASVCPVIPGWMLLFHNLAIEAKTK